MMTASSTIIASDAPFTPHKDNCCEGLPSQEYEQSSPQGMPEAVVDLASDTEWNFRLIFDWNITGSHAQGWHTSGKAGPIRGIRVPGGGFNSDLQEPPFISAVIGDSDNVTVDFTSTSVAEYTRLLPPLPRSLVATDRVLIEIGAVNYGALVFLSCNTSCSHESDTPTLLGAHYNPMMPFAVELPSAEPLFLARATGPYRIIGGYCVLII